MIYHYIRYTIDRHKLADFEVYARRWMEGDILRRCGAEPLGYFLPKIGLGGADNIALALLGFEKAWLIMNSTVSDLVMIRTPAQIWRQRKSRDVL